MIRWLQKRNRTLLLLQLFICYLNSAISAIGSSPKAGESSPFCVVESCEGCRLVTLKHVRQFIKEDLLKYHNTKFKRVPGKSPEMIFYSGVDSSTTTSPATVTGSGGQPRLFLAASASAHKCTFSSFHSPTTKVFLYI